jgi:hypothetical protein
MAFGAIASASSVGCGGLAPAYGAPAIDAGPASIDAAPSVENDAFVLGGTDAAYGGPPVDAAISDDTSLAESDTGGGTNLYGGPPTDAGEAQDDAGATVPLYGGAGI